ncbi:hypothetical protein [Nocardia acidivorans]|uniref:hypothetical protein n=1 Tax=Nocardia acidivorans TaxID=404580 RepID=UPI000AA317F7|nr:hypothetical protein [Nocardia acidivorans]
MNPIEDLSSVEARTATAAHPGSRGDSHTGAAATTDRTSAGDIPADQPPGDDLFQTSISAGVGQQRSTGASTPSRIYPRYRAPSSDVTTIVERELADRYQ